MSMLSVIAYAIVIALLAVIVWFQTVIRRQRRNGSEEQRPESLATAVSDGLHQVALWLNVSR
jgi:hypothetical protein